MAMPKFRIVAKHKDSGFTAQCGAMWESKVPGAYNVSPELEDDSEAQYPKLSLATVSDGTFWLTAFEIKPKGERDDGQ